MSHVAYQSHADRSATSLNGTMSILSKLTARLRHWVELRRVQRHLEGMDDRLLNDIGLERADIHSAIWNGHKLG